MQLLYSEQPESTRLIIQQTTATTEWSFFLESCILQKTKDMAELSTDCTAEKFQRKYLVLKAEKQQLLDLLELMAHIQQLRQLD